MSISERKETAPGVVIEELLPSSLEINSFMKSGLVELVARAYGRNDIYFNLLYSAMGEYKGKNERKTNFVARIDGKPVGSISTSNWKVDDGKNGTEFWKELKSINSAMYEKSLKWPVWGYVMGAVVDPDFRNQGVANNLYKALVKKLQPSFIWGDTKTPQAVYSRAKSLADLGFRTFYGKYEVTPERFQEDAKEHLPILKADMLSEQFTLDENLIFWQDVVALPSYVPNVSSFPLPIQKAFEDVIEAQKKAGDQRVASKPLISIRSAIIPSNP